MNESQHSEESVPVTFASVEVKHDYLYGVTASGKKYPLYVFAPLREAYLGQYRVPFAPAWEPYDVDFALLYIPVPSPIPGPNSDGITLTSQVRGVERDKIRPWDQAMYNGWPLYYVAGHDKTVEKGNHPMMFEPATLGMEPPVREAAVTLPGPHLGP